MMLYILPWRLNADFAKKQKIHKTPIISSFLRVPASNQYTPTACQMKWERVHVERPALGNHKDIILAINAKVTSASISNQHINVGIAKGCANSPARESASASG